MPFLAAATRIIAEHTGICVVSLVHISLFRKPGAPAPPAAAAASIVPASFCLSSPLAQLAFSFAPIPINRRAPPSHADEHLIYLEFHSWSRAALEEAAEAFFAFPGASAFEPLLERVLETRRALLRDPDQVRGGTPRSSRRPPADRCCTITLPLMLGCAG